MPSVPVENSKGGVTILLVGEAGTVSLRSLSKEPNPKLTEAARITGRGNLVLGAQHVSGGRLEIKNGELGNTVVRIYADQENGLVVLNTRDGQQSVRISGQRGQLSLGGSVSKTDGDLNVMNAEGNKGIFLDAKGPTVTVGGRAGAGDLHLQCRHEEPGKTLAVEKVRISLQANEANGYFGGNGEPGGLYLFAKESRTQKKNNNEREATIQVNAENAEVILGGKPQAQAVVPGELKLRAGYQNQARQRIRLSADQATGYLGGSGQAGSLCLFTTSGTATSTERQASIHLDGSDAALRMGGNKTDGDIYLFQSPSDPTKLSDATVSIDGADANLRLGGSGGKGSGADGDVFLYRSSGDRTKDIDATIHLNGSDGNVYLGGSGQDGDVFLLPEKPGKKVAAESVTAWRQRQATVQVSGQGGKMYLGGNGAEGKVFVLPAKTSPKKAKESVDRWKGSQATIQMDGGSGDILMFQTGSDSAKPAQATISLSAAGAELRLGGKGKGGKNDGADGDIFLFAAGGDRTKTAEATVSIDGANANLRLGGTGGQKDGADGDIWLYRRTSNRTKDTDATIHLDGQSGNVYLGGGDADGDLYVLPSGLKKKTSENQESLAAWKEKNATIHLSGDAGDIILKNADCAEEFDVRGNPGPGTVLVIDDSSALTASQRAYDRRVAGVVSGAGELRPGIVLGAQGEDENRVPVALSGKVYCRVDAGFGGIEVGDLLTTSPTPGHAMKAVDRDKAFGAVIGKALGPQKEGTGLVPMLVALQ